MTGRWKRMTALVLAAALSLPGAVPAAAAENGVNQPFNGWSEEENGWYYYQQGAPATGWLQLGQTWYYLGQDGVMQTGWQTVGGQTYYFKDWGGMAAGWLEIDGSWYYFKDWGGMATGWLELADGWYYLDADGKMATGTRLIGGKNYGFDASGRWDGTEKAVTGLQALLNSVALEPKGTVSPALDARVNAFIDAHLSDSMDTYTKVKTVFDYMIENYTYDNSAINITSDETLLSLYLSGAMTEFYAYSILESERGVCNDYSAAFAVILRKLGLETRLVEGIAYTTDGSGSGHAWAEVNLGGTWYLFDPQIEQNIAERDGYVHYYRFGVTMESIPGRYDTYGYWDFAE